MSRILIRPSLEARQRIGLNLFALVGVFALFVGVFQLGASWQRQNVAVGHYCTQDMEACWYEVDFTN